MTAGIVFNNTVIGKAPVQPNSYTMSISILHCVRDNKVSFNVSNILHINFSPEFSGGKDGSATEIMVSTDKLNDMVVQVQNISINVETPIKDKVG